VHFAYEEPKERDITPAQRAYLTNYVNEFEAVLVSESFSDPEHGYRKYIDVDSFVDYHWMTEMSRNIDAFWFSQFYYKDRGGKLKMGPIWDMDLSFGNVAYEDGYKPEGWRGERVGGPHYRWFKRLFEDADFLQRYIDRWGELRTNVFATSNVLARVDAMTAQLDEAQARNYKRWTNLGVKIHPNSFVGKTYREEVDWLKNWIGKRLAWIDTQDFPAPVVHTRAMDTKSPRSHLIN
jgi:spore coat protein CotH